MAAAGAGKAGSRQTQIGVIGFYEVLLSRASTIERFLLALIARREEQVIELVIVALHGAPSPRSIDDSCSVSVITTLVCFVRSLCPGHASSETTYQAECCQTFPATASTVVG